MGYNASSGHNCIKTCRVPKWNFKSNWNSPTYWWKQIKLTVELRQLWMSGKQLSLSRINTVPISVFANVRKWNFKRINLAKYVSGVFIQLYGVSHNTAQNNIVISRHNVCLHRKNREMQLSKHLGLKKYGSKKIVFKSL